MSARTPPRPRREREHAEQPLVVLPGPRHAPARTLRERAESFLIVFPRALCVDGLTFPEVESALTDLGPLVRETEQVHLDRPFIVVPPRDVAKSIQVEV